MVLAPPYSQAESVLGLVDVATAAAITRHARLSLKNPYDYATTPIRRLLVWGWPPLIEAAAAARISVLGGSRSAATPVDAYASDPNPARAPPAGVEACLRRLQSWLVGREDVVFTPGDFKPANLDLSRVRPTKAALERVLREPAGPMSDLTGVSLPPVTLETDTQRLIVDRKLQRIVIPAQVGWRLTHALAAPLARLVLTGVTLDKDDVTNLAQIATLEHLGLRDVRFVGVPSSLAASRSLASLWCLSCPGLTASGLAQMLPAGMQELVVRGCAGMDDRVWNAVSPRASLLTVLRVEECPLVCGAGVAALFRSPIRTLSLRFSSLKDENVCELLSIVSLEHVDLTGTPATGAFVRSVLARHPGLRTIGLTADIEGAPAAEPNPMDRVRVVYSTPRPRQAATVGSAPARRRPALTSSTFVNTP